MSYEQENGRAERPESEMHLSYDIETLGTGPDAVVLSIGAVIFDPHEDYVPDSRFYSVLNLQEQLDMGRTVTADTLKWWLEKVGRKSLLTVLKGGQIVTPMNTAKGILERLCGEFDPDGRLDPDKAVIWTNGVAFDETIIGDLAEDVGVTVPWKFSNTRDVRTVLDFAEVDKREMLKFLEVEKGAPKGTAHNALWDAWAQARLVQMAYAKRRSAVHPRFVPKFPAVFPKVTKPVFDASAALESLMEDFGQPLSPKRRATDRDQETDFAGSGDGKPVGKFDTGCEKCGGPYEKYKAYVCKPKPMSLEDMLTSVFGVDLGAGPDFSNIMPVVQRDGESLLDAVKRTVSEGCKDRSCVVHGKCYDPETCGKLGVSICPYCENMIKAAQA